jgi:hypothetical protein
VTTHDLYDDGATYGPDPDADTATDFDTSGIYDDGRQYPGQG